MPAADTWQAAVDLGARGRYVEAEALARSLVAARDRWSSLALSLIASHRRQVGELNSATRCDADALEAATDAQSRAEAMVGLAADAVASGDADGAAVRLEAAASDCAADWRTLTRWHWVSAEHALLSGDRVRAVDHARDALAACAGRSARHEAKSRIIWAAASGQARDLPGLSPVLREGGWVTLEWPLALVAADHPDAVPSAWLAQAWQAGRGATYVVEEGLPEELRAGWRTHPGVRRLRERGAPLGGE